MRRPLFIASSVAALGVFAVGCSDTVEPAPPQIVLAIGTDLHNGEIDAFQLEVLNSGGVIDQNTYSLSDTFLPATKSLVYGETTTGGITARVIGSLRGVERIRKEVTFSTRPTGVKMQRLPLEFLCLDQPACPAGQTCSAGKCVPSAADVTKLEDFSESKVFGGEKKQCFDVDACFASGVYLNPVQAKQLGECVAAIPAATPDSMNIAIVHHRTGCPDTGCIVPLLPDSDSGWKLSGSTVRFPEAVCSLIANGGATNVRVVRSNLCQKLSIEIPPCGESSSVSESPIVPSNPPAQKGFAEIGK